MIRFEQTFMNFLLEHQEKHKRTHNFLILMDAMISAANHIQHYYLTGALKGNLGLAGDVNVQGEDPLQRVHGDRQMPESNNPPGADDGSSKLF